MGVAENKETVRKIYAAMETGDTRAFGEAVHADYRWRLVGHCSWSGVHTGRKAIARDLLGPLFSRFATPYKAKLVSLIGEGEVVVAEVEGEATTHEGVRYNNQYCFIFRFREGRIAEVVEYADTDLEERVLGPYAKAVATARPRDEDSLPVPD